MSHDISSLSDSTILVGFLYFLLYAIISALFFLEYCWSDFKKGKFTGVSFCPYVTINLFMSELFLFGS